MPVRYIPLLHTLRVRVVHRVSETDNVKLANLEVKSKAPNGVTFSVKGKGSHEGTIGGLVCLSHLRNRKALWRFWY